MNKGIFWFALFSLILALSTVYLFAFEGSGPGWLGFPKWLYGFFLIEVGLVAGIFAYVKYYWKSPGEE